MIGKMKILVGLSWGVDSAVAAYLLKEQGHEVVAGFMKNYETCLADMERNKRMSPQEALEYGLIDKIIWA